MKCTLSTETLEFSRLKVPNSRFSPSLIHGLCAFFAPNSGFMRLFQAALDTPLNNPFSATLSVHGLRLRVSKFSFKLSVSVFILEFRRPFVTCDFFARCFFRGFFLRPARALICLEKQCLGFLRGFFVALNKIF